MKNNKISFNKLTSELNSIIKTYNDIGQGLYPNFWKKLNIYATYKSMNTLQIKILNNFYFNLTPNPKPNELDDVYRNIQIFKKSISNQIETFFNKPLNIFMEDVEKDLIKNNKEKTPTFKQQSNEIKRLKRKLLMKNKRRELKL